MRKHIIAIAIVIGAIVWSTVLIAQPGLGISKTAPISGTGSSGSPLKLDVCASGSAYVSNGTSWECGTAGTTYTAGDGLLLTGADFDINYGTGLGITADTLHVNLTGASCGAGSAVTAIASDGTGTCTAVGVSDGDKGDITVSGGSWFIDSGAVDANELANNAVTNAKMADDSVGTAEIAVDGVGASEISAGAVGTSEISDNLDLSGNGSTTVGDLRGTVETLSTSSAVTDYALGATTTTLVITPGANIAINSFTGGASGRELLVIVDAALGYDVTFVHEHGSSTAANRIAMAQNANWIDSAAGFAVKLVWDAAASRWRGYPIGAARFPTLISTGIIAGFGAFSISGNATLGDASGDTHTVNGSLTITNGLSVQSSGTTFQSGVALGNDISDAINVGGTLLDASSAPTYSSCGTSPTHVSGGSTAFTVTVGTGTTTACTATFAGTKTNTPTCAASVNNATEDVYVSLVSATAVTVTAKSGTTDLAGDNVTIVCFGDG